MDSTGSYQGIFNQSSITTDASELIITGLIDNKVIGSIGGILTNNVSTDGLSEGKTNQYYTDGRARNALTGGTSIIYYPLTGQINTSQAIDTNSSPQFARLLNSSLGTYSVLLGTNTGNAFTGDRCVLIGDSVMTATSSSQQSTAIGNSALGFATGDFNTAVGANAGFGLSTGTVNTIIGTNAGRGATPLTTGSYNVLLGAGANTSSGSSNNEIVIGYGVGAGNNTAKIYASNGLYVSNLTNGVIKATSGLITSNATTDDLIEGKTNLYYTDTRARGAFSEGTGVSITSGVIAIGQAVGTTNSPQFAGLTLGTLSGVLKATAGVVANGATTDDLTEGKTNLYFTDARAQGAFSAGTGISIASGVITNTAPATITSITGTANQIIVSSTVGVPSNLLAITLSTPQDIGTGSSPQFARLLNSSIGTRNLLLGTSAGNAITTSVDAVAIGNNALSTLSTAINCTAIGSLALSTCNANNNTAIGFKASNILTSGFQNTTVGAFAGGLLTTGKYNNLFGMSSGYNISSGDTNFCLGLNAGYSITTSSDNIAIGAYTMAKNLNPITTTNGRNVAIGHYASNSLAGTPENNITIGYQSMSNATSCSSNICIGTNAGNSITTGGGNIAIGGSSLSTGGTLTAGQGGNIGIGIASNLYVSNSATNNIGIGSYSNLNTSTGVSNISIGPYTQASSATGSNQIVISTNGVSGTPISGKGDNTAFIDARRGLFSYCPAFYWGYTGNQTNALIWNTLSAQTRNMSLQSGDSSKLLLPYIGFYEISLSGSAAFNGSANAIHMYVNGNVYISSAVYVGGGYGWLPMGFNSIVNCTSVNTYVQFAVVSGNIVFQTSPACILMAKFISL